MMKKFSLFILFGVIWVAMVIYTTATGGADNRSQGREFQEAIHLMETKGDYPAAIRLFEKVANEPDRSIAAQALLYVGICYEKLGKDEAQKAYLRIIREFSDQQEIVANAQARLAVMKDIARSQEEAGMVVRKIYAGPGADDGLGEVSPDGKFFSFVDWNTGDLATWEIASQKIRHLTNKGSWQQSGEMALFSSWSNDGTQIAYDWFLDPSGKNIEIRIVDLNNITARVLFHNENQEMEPVTCDWFPDGKHILATFYYSKNQTAEIVSISVTDGSVKVLKKVDNIINMLGIRCSPDGQYIVYDCPQKGESPGNDIFLLSRDGSQEFSLTRHLAHDESLGWTPDGKHILFKSDRSGSPGIWIIRVEDGKPQGFPELITTVMDPITSLGFTNKGSFYYSTSPNRTNIYVLELDPETGEIMVPPKEAVQHHVGINSTPAYSPDGKYLAYTSRREPFRLIGGERPCGNVLCIQSLETGKLKEFRPAIKQFDQPEWFPDGQSVTIIEWNFSERKKGIYKIDVQTGNMQLIVQGEIGKLHSHLLSPDGNKIYLLREDRENKTCAIMIRDVAGGPEKEIYRESTPNRDISISLSPDGKWLSLIDREKNRTIKLLPSQGGTPRVLYNWDLGDNSYIRHIWSNDGKYIFLSLLVEKESGKYDIWRIPVDSGELQKLGLETTKIWGMSLHPDGRYLAFSNQGDSYKIPEIWVMENFLPELKESQ